MMRTLSLKTLLVLVLAAAFLTLGGLLFVANLAHTRDFLNRQLQSHAQDAATTLALQLSPAFAQRDQARIENTVDALFDSGYYQRIALTRPDGAAILLRDRAILVEGAPQWFIRMLPLDTPSGRAEAMAGWQRAAVVEVASHPGYAYRQLWQNTRSVLLWTLALGALAALAAVWLLRRALRSLSAMEHLARSVANGQFEQLAEPPRVRELSHIAQALNRMSASVARMQAEKSRLIDNLQEDLYHDLPTGLYNRNYLIAATEAALAEPDSHVGLAILRIGGLAAINGRLGRVAGDQLLHQVADQLVTLAKEHSGLAGRLDGGQFAILLQAVDTDRLSRIAERLAQAGLLALRGAGSEEYSESHVGAAVVSGAQRPALFAAADAALRDARLGPSGSYRLADGETPGQHDMHKVLLAAIEQTRFSLEWQPVLRCADLGEDHLEAYARIADPRGGYLAAGSFVHLAEECGLIATLDELILTDAWLTLDGKRVVGSVNLSTASLVSPGFVDWMRGLILHPEKLQVEFTLPGLLAHPLALEAAARLREGGFRIVLDRFIPQAEALNRLREIRPQMVKVEGTLCRQARHDPGARALLKTLCDYARELGIRVGATGVEQEGEREVLCALGFETLQGRLFKAEALGGAHRRGPAGE